jgi:hypothetical protein
MKTRSDLIPPPQRVRPAAQREARTPAAAGAAGNQREAAQLERIQAAFGAAPAQLAGEEEELQMKADLTAQRIGMEEEEPLQGRFVAQRVEEEEPLQGRFEPAASPANKTGMPDALKSGVEALSGMDLSDVRVHANSSQPAQLGAHAYAQGNDIHVAPGQEQHLPHEAWHVVQQRQGRVQPTTQMAGVDVNDDHSLEAEADAMGAKAMRGPNR